MKLVGYARRSREQGNGYGIDAQRLKIGQWAAWRDHEVVDVLVDDDVSGASRPEERPGFAAALDLIGSKEAEGLVVAKFDRLARSVRHFTRVLQRSREERWALVCLDPELDTTTASGRAFAHMLATFAQFEFELFQERSRAARQGKAARGGYVGGFADRYGYRVEDGEWVPIPEEQVVVERARQLRLGAGLTLQAVADLLNSEGCRTKRGGRWHATTVSRVMNST